MARRLRLIDEVSARSLDDARGRSSFMGPMTGRDWSRLQANHFDHHLSQFGVQDVSGGQADPAGPAPNKPPCQASRLPASCGAPSVRRFAPFERATSAKKRPLAFTVRCWLSKSTCTSPNGIV